MGSITAFIAMTVRRWNPFYQMYDDEVGQGAERGGTVTKAAAPTEIMYVIQNDYFLLRNVTATNNAVGAAVILTLEDGAGGANRFHFQVANNGNTNLTNLEGIRFDTDVSIFANAIGANNVEVTVGGLDRNY